MFTIKEPDVKAEERTPEINVKTKIYQAIPIKNTSEESAFIVTTARKSNIEMNYSCPECGVQLRKQELEKCPDCGGDYCSQCLPDHDCETE